MRLARTGVSVRVLEVGRGAPVVFVHGASNCGASWAALVAHLKGFRCLLLDRPGCGLSDPLPTRFIDVADLATFGDTLLVDLLDAMGLDRVHVVATSFGGYLALRAAAAHPDRIGRVMELGWTVGAPVNEVPLVMRLAGVPAVGRALAAVPPNERAVRALFRRIGLRQAMSSGRVSQEMLDAYLALLRDTATMRNEINAGPRVFTLRGTNDRVVLPEELLAAIDAPVYFLWGEEDPYGGPAIARAFVEKLPNAELELVPGAGHAVWIDDPDRTAATTGRFLAT